MTTQVARRAELNLTASVEAAFDAFECLRGELFGIMRELREGETDRARKLAPVITEMSKALGTFLKEYDKIEALKEHMTEADKVQHSISGRRAQKSNAAWIASGPRDVQLKFLRGLSPHEQRALPYLWEFWALDHQLPPQGDWRTWVIMGGRGAGKTRAGSEWVRAQVEGARPDSPGTMRRVALVGETLDQAREVMVFGDSGILACSPPDRRPEWQATRRRLVWPNGAVAQIFSASDPESLRGPQFDAAWSDELGKWAKAQDTWDMLQFALRLGDAPRQVVTTTPRNQGLLKDVLERTTTVVTGASTEANRANLAASFLEDVRLRYGGTRLGRQELDGELVADLDGAYWSPRMLDALRVTEMPELNRVVVALDPAVSAGSTSDACGIVVVGAVIRGDPKDWHAVVLEDATVQGCTTLGWAEAAIAAMARHNADRLVAEVNQGGDLVREVLTQVDPMVPYHAVTAKIGKAARAEPVAALYEQGRVRHVKGLANLEAQMCQMTRTGFQGSGSPDRVDALVWALTELVLEPARAYRRPGVRSL